MRAKAWILALGIALASPFPALGQEYTLGRVGEIKSGRDRYGELRCPDGSHMVGLHVQAGTYVDGIGLRCARPSSRVSLGSPFNGPEMFGQQGYAELIPGMSSRERVVFCPDDHVLSGINARGGDWVDRIDSIRCVRFKSTPDQTVTVSMGGTGGTRSASLCRSGHQISRLTMQVGNWVNMFEATCRPQA